MHAKLFSTELLKKGHASRSYLVQTTKDLLILRLFTSFPSPRTPVLRRRATTWQPVKQVLQTKDIDVCVLQGSKVRIARMVSRSYSGG